MLANFLCTCSFWSVSILPHRRSQGLQILEAQLVYRAVQEFSPSESPLSEVLMWSGVGWIAAELEVVPAKGLGPVIAGVGPARSPDSALWMPELCAKPRDRASYLSTCIEHPCLPHKLCSLVGMAQKASLQVLYDGMTWSIGQQRGY